MKIKINRKMKKSVYKSGMLLLLSALFLLPLKIMAQEVTKEFHKEYKAGKNTTLNISNRYGDVVIQSWEKDQVIIDIKVSVDLPNKERAEKLLGYIDIQFEEGENLITANTVIDNKFLFSGWGNESKRFSIDYNIKMPAGINLTLENNYGNADLDEHHGLINLDIKYGNLTAAKLTRGNEKPLNRLNIAYGKASIDEAGWLDLRARYASGGGVEIKKSQALLIDSRYSKLVIGETSSIVSESKYDNISIGNINNLVMMCGYSAIKINKLLRKLNFQGSYGSCSVNEIPAGFESLEVKVSYMGVRLGIDETSTYKLDANARYGSIKFNEEKFKNGKHISENNSTVISGIFGSQISPSSTVKVTTAYGSVKLY
jgi:hypothetical protein